MTDPTTPENSEPATGPVLTPPAQTPPPQPVAYNPEPPQTIYVQQSSRLNKAAAWVGIVAGSVFTVAVIFGAGFVVGKQSGDGPRYHHRGPDMLMRPAPAMFPMGPPGGFERGPAFHGPFGPGGPMIDVPQPSGPAAPTTAPRP